MSIFSLQWVYQDVTPLQVKEDVFPKYLVISITSQVKLKVAQAAAHQAGLAVSLGPQLSGVVMVYCVIPTGWVLFSCLKPSFRGVLFCFVFHITGCKNLPTGHKACGGSRGNAGCLWGFKGAFFSMIRGEVQDEAMCLLLWRTVSPYHGPSLF